MAELMEFKAAQNWLKSRVSVPTDMTSSQLAFSPDFPARVKAHAFFSARVTEANILEQLREQVNQLAAGEINIATARMRLKTFLAGQGIPADDVGMTGKPPAGVDEKTWKARKSVTNLASTRRLDLILRQNSAMAHAVGRREVSMQPAVRQRWPYFRYLARMDGRQRATHGRYNNLVLPKQHPFWHTHTGPWDFECRCDVEDADEAEAKEYGKGQVAGTKVFNPATGQTFEDLPNESGFEFDIEEALAGDPENFDWGQIKNAVLREKVRKQVTEKVQTTMGGGAADDIEMTADVRLAAAEAELVTNRFGTLVAVRRDGSVALRKVGKKYSVPMTDEENDQLADCRVTHNHPRGWDHPADDPRRAGNSFSRGDIGVAAGHNAAEMRAVSPKWLHTMQRPEDGWPNLGALESEYRKANKATKKAFWNAVDKGEMTIPEAEAEHQHRVWTRVADRLGLDYQRRERT